MRLTDEYEEQNESRTNLPVIYMMLGGMLFFVLIISMVLVSNTKRPKSHNNQALTSQAVSENKEKPTDELHLGESTLESDDLDFWDMYKTDVAAAEESVSSNKTDKSARSAFSILITSVQRMKKQLLSCQLPRGAQTFFRL